MLTSRTKSDMTSTKNKILIFFYRNLQSRIITERETTNPIKEISKVADDWKNYIKGFQTYQLTELPLTTVTDPLRESFSLLFTEEILAFCSKHNLYHECCRYYNLFIENFKHIQKIDVLINEDPEIFDYKKVSFILTIADNIENVLIHEDAFRDRLDKEIPIEKRHFFVYSYNLI